MFTKGTAVWFISSGFNVVRATVVEDQRNDLVVMVGSHGEDYRTTSMNVFRTKQGADMAAVNRAALARNKQH